MSRQRSLPMITAALLASALAVAPVALSAQAAPAAQAPAAPAPGGQATASQAAPVPVRSSWVADRRLFGVGDIITVLIDDYTISTAVKEHIAQDLRNRDLGVNARIPGTAQGADVNSRNNANQISRGQARRENRFQNEMSVRVVAVGPNGLLQVKGTKKIDVDRSLQDIVFTGWVRAQDVSVTNVVESSRVADAQLGYASPGSLGKPKQGLITKFVGALWP